MKAQIEKGELEYPGIEVISENDEEKKLLETLWLDAAKVVMFSREDAALRLTFAPTRIEEKE